MFEKSLSYRYAFVFLLTLLFSFSQKLDAQTFPENPEEFVQALENKMTSTKRPDLVEAYEVFEAIYKTGRIKAEEMSRLAAICNRLESQRLAANPYFREYINAVSAAKTDADTTLFDTWHSFLEKTIELVPSGKTKQISQILTFSNDFLNHRAFMLGESGSVTWKIKGGSFKFVYKDQPELFVENVNITGIRKTDSIEIKKTTGVYFPFEEQYKGNGGKVTWERVGLDSTVYATLTDYVLEAKKPLYSCENATFYYPLYFPKGGLIGKFEDQVVVSNKAASDKFPVFESSDKSLEIGKIGEGIKYKGGFKIRGGSIYGSGTFEEPAELSIFNAARKQIFIGTGSLFIIRHEENIIAEDVHASLIMGEDSIVHPSINFKIDIQQGIIDLHRGQKATSRNPFYSTFYNMSLDAEKITWFLKSDSLDIGSRTGLIKGIEQSVTFESSNFYDANEYAKIQNISSRNPIASLLLLYKQQKDASISPANVISDSEFAQKMDPKWDRTNAQTILAELSKKGFIRYYFEQHKIVILPKTFHYAAASSGKSDFDNIKIISTTNEANAQLDLKTYETKINNVDVIEFSPKQRVAAKLLDKNLTMLKNRNMRFNGTVFAGKTSMVAKNFEFDYDKFQIAFDSAIYLDFYVPTGDVDSKGKPISKALNSTIEYASGVVLIDAPNNKSGKDDLPTFSSLQIKKPSYVFYDKKEIENGEYVRDSFYFALNPFPFNGLDSYGKEQLSFKGTLVSSEIFPPFEERLVVRDKDQSFGFVHKTPGDGYPTFQKKGNFTGDLDLSNRGLWGIGKLEYLTADVDSEDLLFKPRQALCTAKKFTMDEDRTGAVKTPQALGEDVAVDWKPYQDSMYVRTKGRPFELFKEPGYTHKGMFILTPSGLKGRGEFEWDGGILTSKLISYAPFKAASDTADLKIKALNAKDIVFDSRNIDGELDFDKSIGRFKANSDSASTTLPYDQYKTSMNEFTWDMKAQTINFKADEKRPGEFTSIDPNQDSLSFTGKTAFYDMKTNELRVGGVPFVKSADAYIYAETGNIAIEPGGKMAELSNARIEADTASKYHVINRCKVNISGKKNFTAEGYYEYNIPGYEQEIFFDNIVGDRFGAGLPSEKNVKTTARGSAKEEDNFHMDQKVQFKGDIILNSPQQNLRFEGYAKLEAESLPRADYFTVRGETDKKNPIIEIKGAKNESDEPLVDGFYISREFGSMYPRILKPPYARVDRPVLVADEMLRYNVAQNQFIFGDSARVTGESLTGNLMILSDNTGEVRAEGKMNLGSGLNYMSIKGAGELRANMQDTSSNMKIEGDLMTGIEFIFPNALYDFIVNDIRASAFDASPVVFSNQIDFYDATLPTFLPDAKAQTDAKALVKANQLVLPKKDNKYSFLLGKHAVKWNQDYSSFISMTDRVPVISINGEPINKMLTVFTEYKMPGNGDDRWYIYLKANNDLWYFFGYQAGVLNVTSSSTRFNDALLSLKKKDMIHKMPDGETYEIIPVEAITGERFVNRVKEGRN